MTGGTATSVVGLRLQVVISFGIDRAQLDPCQELFSRLLPDYSSGVPIDINGEFDPGSGRMLAACLTHASRTVMQGLPC
jgi:hypothetical protein